MKTKTKALALALCAVLLVVGTVFATMAYLTSTDEVVNTFTVGQVHIKLDEAKVNEDGEPLGADGKVVENVDEAERISTADDAETPVGNKYHLLPGQTYVKDPTVTLLADSEDCYIRAIITVNFNKALTDELIGTDLSDIVLGYSENWVRHDKTVSDDNTTLTYEFWYQPVGVTTYIVPGTRTTGNETSTDCVLPDIFTEIKVPEEWDNEDIAAVGNFTIDIVAHAIQADGFANAEAAWEAFKNQ